MIYTTLTQRPETPINEKWEWPTDVITADDGTVQTISLAPVPKRSWSGSFVFDRAQDIRRHLATMFQKFSGTFYFPLWHQLVKIKAKLAIAATTIYCTTARSEFFVGGLALLSEGDKSELVTINTVLADRVTLAGAGTVYSYSARAVLCPVTVVYSADNAAFVRQPGNDGGSASFNFMEYSARSPFIADADKVVLPTFNDLPVLLRRNVGQQFGYAMLTGAEVTDFGGQPSIRSRWLNPKLITDASFLSDRQGNPADWKYWRTFFDYARGGALPFYFPTWRNDLLPLAPAAAGAVSIDLSGTEYGDHLWPIVNNRAVMFRRDDGTTHLANITARAIVGGNDRLTFAPALPAGDWSTMAISLLLKVRIGDDTVALTHNGPDSLISINLRTID